MRPSRAFTQTTTLEGEGAASEPAFSSNDEVDDAENADDESESEIGDGFTDEEEDDD